MLRPGLVYNVGQFVCAARAWLICKLTFEGEENSASSV